MGGAVTLLLVATMGITFGWTPDGADGVKYIIQVPPDQLDQLERVGEITSTISPEVRGRVSEIVIRVGNGPVPREVPARWMTNASHPSGVSQVVSDEDALRGLPIAADDRRPIPIPMSSNSTQPGVIPGNVNSPSITRLMKPQSGGMSMPGGFEAPAPTGGPSTSGFNMPPSLATGPAGPAPSTAAPNTGSLNDSLRAGAEAFGEATRRTLGLGTPNTASTNPNMATRDPSMTVAPPPFTGPANSGAMDRSARAGGPSTDPAASTGTNARPWPNDDDNWYALGNRPAQRPSTAPVNNSTADSMASTTGAPPRPGTDPANRNNPNTGFSTGNFNQMPSGLNGQSSYGQTNADTVANSSSRRDTPYSNPATGRDNTINRNEYAPGLTAAQAARLPDNGYDFDDAGVPIDRAGYRLNVYGERIDQNGRPLNDSSYADTRPGANTGVASTPQASDSNPFPGRTSATNQPTRGYPDSTYASQQGNSPTQPAYPDNRNTASGAPANPQAPNGQAYPNPNSQQSPPTMPNTYAAQPTSGYPNPNQPAAPYLQVPNYNTNPPYAATNPAINPATGYPYTNANYPNTGPTYLASNNAPTGAPPIGGSNAGAPPRNQGSSSSDNLDATTGPPMDNGSRPDREKVATQTLFNALLLVSFVANLYLMYWLNVLRLKYQEMVAAKRAAASSNATAVA
ncbi:mu-protocadherin [Rhodopirellula bahusiensis]|uniref:mu-protocadherin n=1 Tax=Rhodopirellula bahusiensis TaxID=2014065 RepID=UPI0032630CEB